MRGNIGEYFIYAQCNSEQQGAAALTELSSFLQDTEAQPVSIRLFVKKTSCDKLKTQAAANLERLPCPVVWISQPDKTAIAALSFQVHAVAGTAVQPVFNADRKAGCRFQDKHAAYYLLHTPPAASAAGRGELTRNALADMQDTLRSAGLDFSRTLRTWFFADDILSWYGQLNAARDGFFQEHHIFDKLVPASTGIGTANPLGAALTAELLAVEPLNGHLQIRAVASPLQCEALDYKSSFSRAVVMQAPDHRRLYVSGTASIDRHGRTAHTDNCAKQIELTMQVVEALIKNGSMDWANSARAIAYFKDCRDFGLFDAFCRDAGLALPHIKIEADICRDDLLFELELDLLDAG